MMRKAGSRRTGRAAFLFLFLCVCALCTALLTSCGEKPLPIPEDLPGHFYYNMLSEQAKTLYIYLKDSAEQFSVKETGVPADLDSVSLAQTASRLLSDEPRLFYLDLTGTVLTPKDGSYTLKTGFLFEEKEILEKRNELESVIKDFSAGLEQAAVETEDDFSKALFAYDYLISICEKAASAANDTEEVTLPAGEKTSGGAEEAETAFNPLQSTAYGALVSGNADQAGYSLALRLLFEAAGLDSLTVNGKQNGENAVWVLVSLDGKYYIADAYSDDPRTEELPALGFREDIGADEYSDLRFHTHFCPIAEIAGEYLPGTPGSIPTPSEENDYFTRLSLNGSDAPATTDLILSVLNSGKDQFEIKFFANYSGVEELVRQSVLRFNEAQGKDVYRSDCVVLKSSSYRTYSVRLFPAVGE